MSTYCKTCRRWFSDGYAWCPDCNCTPSKQQKGVDDGEDEYNKDIYRDFCADPDEDRN